MKVLILGGDGMLGHQLVRCLNSAFDVHATFRKSEMEYSKIAKWLPERSYFGINARVFSTVETVIQNVTPDVIINSIGIVKQREESHNSIVSIEVNSLFPHKLSVLADQVGARFITVSTDCVFSGNKGMYSEDDSPDAADIYGRSKLMGEVCDPNALTLRTSIIGLELTRKKGLVEWFLSQNEQIHGYSKAIYSGLTTVELARVIKKLLIYHPRAMGLYHVSSDPISKYELLSGLRDRLKLGIEILRDESFVNDKSLNSEKFRSEFEYTPPSWDDMLDELAKQIGERDNEPK